MQPITRSTMKTSLIRQHPPAFQSNNSSNENNRSLFYKTRFCDRFKAGCCPLRSEDCSYAHEASDLHDPPDNWHDKANWRPQKFCNWYNSGKDCPYGSKCAFLHLGQEKQLLNGHSRFQEPSNIISIETNKFSSEINGEQRPLPTKKKICFNWTRTGSCTFGNNCLYAHGHTDQRNPSSSTEAEGPRGGGGLRVSVSDLANACRKDNDEKERPAYNSKRVREREFEYNHRKKNKTELAVNMEYINSKCIKWRSQIYADWI